MILPRSSNFNALPVRLQRQVFLEAFFIENYSLFGLPGRLQTDLQIHKTSRILERNGPPEKHVFPFFAKFVENYSLFWLPNFGEI